MRAVRRRELSGVDARAAARPARRAGRTPGGGPARSRRRGRPGRPSSSPTRRATARATSTAAREVSGHERHDGNDVGGARPAGARPRCTRRSIRRLASAMPATSPSSSAASSPTSVTTPTVVVGVEMGVEHARACPCEGARDRGDHPRVAALGDVRDGLEQDHAPTLRPMREPTAPAYYDRRAPEYDDWYLGRGLYSARDRDGFDEDLARVCETLAALAPARNARCRVRHRLPHAASPRRRDRARPERTDARGGRDATLRRDARPGRRARPPVPGRRLRPGRQRPLLRAPRRRRSAQRFCARRVASRPSS